MSSSATASVSSTSAVSEPPVSSTPCRFAHWVTLDQLIRVSCLPRGHVFFHFCVCVRSFHFLFILSSLFSLFAFLFLFCFPLLLAFCLPFTFKFVILTVTHFFIFEHDSHFPLLSFLTSLFRVLVDFSFLDFSLHFPFISIMLILPLACFFSRIMVLSLKSIDIHHASAKNAEQSAGTEKNKMVRRQRRRG